MRTPPGDSHKPADDNTDNDDTLDRLDLLEQQVADIRQDQRVADLEAQVNDIADAQDSNEQGEGGYDLTAIEGEGQKGAPTRARVHS